MASRREQILGALKTTLESVSSPTDLTNRVERSLAVAIGRTEAPIVSLDFIRDTPTNETVHRLVWHLLVRVTLIVRGTPPDSIADPILNSIHAAIMADQTLGLGVQFVMEIVPVDVAFEVQDSDGGGGRVSIDYMIQYQTSLESFETL